MTVFRRLAKRLIYGIRGGRRAGSPPLGAVALGDLATTVPVSSDFGWDRGEPIDRFYIADFLARHADAIQGRALEIGDASYCTRYGNGRVRHQDVLHRHAVPGATIVGDLAEPDTLPAGVFDVIVLTQTLHLIFDMPAALRQLRRALRPGGSLLLTAPGITPLDRKEWRSTWFWSLTEASLVRLLQDSFPGARITAETYGNVYAATLFLQGLVTQDARTDWLEVRDESYPVIVAAQVRIDG